MLKAHAKRVAKDVYDVYFAAKAGVLRAMGVVDFPVPPNHNLRTTSSATLRHYYESGLTTFLPIAVSAMREGLDLREKLKVLDFGCGAARQLLHFTRRFPNCSYSGCDVNTDVIDFIHKAYPQVDAYANEFDPPLKWGDGTFDMIYSVSIFSHLSAGDRDLWVAELHRVTKPGGMCLLTVNGLHSLRRSHEQGNRRQFSEEQLEKDGLIFDPYPQATDEARAAATAMKHAAPLIGVTRIYGETYHSANHARDVFARPGFECRAILPGIIDDLQDLVVLRKR